MDSTATTVHPATITFATPDGYDDPAPGDHIRHGDRPRGPASTCTCPPLTPDAAPPADDADRHRVTTTAQRRPGRAGLGHLLADRRRHLRRLPRVHGRPAPPLTCADPSDGPVTFTLRSGDVHQSRTVRIAVPPPRRPSSSWTSRDDADSGRCCAPRPSYPFALGTLTPAPRRPSPAAPTTTRCRTTVAAPAGADGLVLALTDGGSLAPGQGTGCTRLDDTHLRCDGGPGRWTWLSTPPAPPTTR